MTADDDPATSPDDPTTSQAWDELREDAASIAGQYADRDWDAVVVDPVTVSPNEDDDRFGFDVVVSTEEYDILESLVEDDGATVDDAEVYYRPAEGATQRYALVVERDTASETAICVPLSYAITEARPVLERALVEEELLVHVRPTDAKSTDSEPEQWITFAHDDPSLFLEEADARKWDLV